MRPQNFQCSFGASPQHFEIQVNPDFLNYTRQKLELTRFAEDVDQPDFTDGPPTHKAMAVRDYWVNEYNWESVQSKLNNEQVLPLYWNARTDILLGCSNLLRRCLCPPIKFFAGTVPLHFVHHVSPRADAIPLLFIHGWPGSFLEVRNIIKYLTHPSRDTDPAFHVVAPSIPGFGFSPAPTKPGFGLVEAAHAFDALMKQLNYNKYVIQGGDLGGLILRHQAHLYPESVISCHSNFWVVSPNTDDLELYKNNGSSTDEKAIIELYQGFINNRWAYAQVQQTTPLRLAHGLTDSPVGLAMWYYHAMHPGVVSSSFWTLEDIITWTMMYWIQGPNHSLRFYKEAAKVRICHTDLRWVY